MLCQLKADKAPAPSTLGGGSNDYLCILFSPTQYAIVTPNTTFVPPTYPGVLTIPDRDTQYNNIPSQIIAQSRTI